MPYHEIYYVSASEIIAIHMAIMKNSGKQKIYVMKNRIEEIEEQYRTIKGDILYKAAILLYNIIKERPRPFQDGHKRTGWISIVRFFRKNNYYFFDSQKLADKAYIQKNVVKYLIDIQQGKISKMDSIKTWLQGLFTAITDPGF